LFNGTSTQNGKVVPTAGKGNWLRRLRMANEIQCIIYDNNATQFTVKHSSYINATTGYVFE